MLLDLARIRTPHERYEKEYPASAFAADADYAVAGPVKLSFDIHKDKETFRLDGRVSGTLELRCSRCLESFQWPVDEPFELTYQPRAAVEGMAQEREIADQDFSAALYDNEQIDLEQLIRERFEMSLPMKPLCTDECRGLCPVCGANLNRQTCGCKTEWDDPRMAVLKKLRADS
jgi:uncharacterized protein